MIVAFDEVNLFQEFCFYFLLINYLSVTSYSSISPIQWSRLSHEQAKLHLRIFLHLPNFCSFSIGMHKQPSFKTYESHRTYSWLVFLTCCKEYNPWVTKSLPKNLRQRLPYHRVFTKTFAITPFFTVLKGYLYACLSTCHQAFLDRH